MQVYSDRFIYSATDLSSFVQCPHLPHLRRAWTLREITKPFFDDPSVDALARRGAEHEAAYLADCHAQGLKVVELSEPDVAGIDKLRIHADATIDAMRAGADVIYQGALFDGTWFGKTDFLHKVPGTSRFGDYAYEVVDAKLARNAKAPALLQVLLYADMLSELQVAPCDRVGLALAGPNARTEYFRVADYAAYYRSVKRRFLALVEGPRSELPIAPDVVEHCGICEWSPRCEKEREEVDHLSLVAGITRRNIAVLRANDINTLEALGTRDVPGAAPGDMTEATFARIHGQARLQLEGRTTGTNVHELLLPVVENLGLAGLPAPSEGDIYFDLESDNNAFVNGIEYLFGYCDRAGAYRRVWALTPEDEKAAFEAFVDFISARKQQYPDMHVYHYAAHETTALKQIMSRYGTREDEVDDLLREETFVDLLRVVKQGLRASVDSYSIKKMEPFYNFRRRVDLADARKALAHMELWLEFGDVDIDIASVRDVVAGYNRDDCESLLHLQNWLEQLRQTLIDAGTGVPRPQLGSRLRNDEDRREDEAIAALRERLLAGVPADEKERSDEERVRWLLGNLPGFHKREDRSFWGDFFRRTLLSDDDLIEEREAIGGLEFVGMVPQSPTPTGRARPPAHRFRFPPQEHNFEVDNQAKRRKSGDAAADAKDRGTEAVGTVVAVNDAHHTIDLRLSKNLEGLPTSIIRCDWINPEPLPASIVRTATAYLDGGRDDDGYDVAMSLMRREKPRLKAGELMLAGENVVAAGRRLVHALDRTVLPIQGPPGAGKTYLAARMILEAVQSGKRVGVTAPSHPVICNLLDEVFRAADAERYAVRVAQKPSRDGLKHDRADKLKDAAAVEQAFAEGAQIVAGTAWLWAHELLPNSVDILFIDEGGQFSLANALAVAPAARSMVILGDPQQLDQPRKGVHPEGCDESALDHLLNGAQTISSDRGLFLDQTWRLHPDICAFTSEIFYDGRLVSRPNLHNQCVLGDSMLGGSGVRVVLVDHDGNENESAEESAAIGELLNQLHAAEWQNKDGECARIGRDDVVIVAPYNAQVDRIADGHPDAWVGTVDKFQGQEAAVAIYSLASSSAAEAPRGMQFLFSPNRFNVATSRGRCLAIVVASPALFAPECRTPEQMRWANAFCRFLEMAGISVPYDHGSSRAGEARLPA
jgi:predicted RecB family nuclease